MSVPTVRVLDPVFGKPILRSANNGMASWSKVNNLSQWQKGNGWQVDLYGGLQTRDDWASVFIPVNELHLTDFNSARWSYYMTATQTMGVGIVIWIHDNDDLSKRAEVTQLANVSGLGKAEGWNSHTFNKATTQMFFYGENTTGTKLTAGTQYKWSQFQEDPLFRNWTIYRISFDYGWEASGTFDHVWLAEINLNGLNIPLKPGDGESVGGWKNAVIDIDRDTEFSGDDVDRYSSLVDLGDDFKYATVFIPAIDSAAVTPYLQRDGQVATVPVASHFWNDADADTNVIQSTIAGTGGITITFFVGCCQYLRLYAGANQTADRTFYVKGHN